MRSARLECTLVACLCFLNVGLPAGAFDTSDEELAIQYGRCLGMFDSYGDIAAPVRDGRRDYDRRLREAFDALVEAGADAGELRALWSKGKREHDFLYAKTRNEGADKRHSDQFLEFYQTCYSLHAELVRREVLKR